LNTPTLIVILGPTGIGKTSCAIELAKHFRSPIISGDSRQIFKELKIGTAVPSQEQLNAVKHYLIGTQSITQYYSAYEFEQDVLKLTQELFQQHNPLILAGGSMMYIDAACKGIDELPTIDAELRDDLFEQYEKEGIEPFRRMLKQMDAVYYDQVDLKNHKRVIHAVEVCMMTGVPYSSLRKNKATERPFNLLKIGLNTSREKLYKKINLRVDQMISDGLLDEARLFHPQKHLNSLNTVGYKELFDYFDNKLTLNEAIELIKRNSRRYAKRQIAWFNKDKETIWFEPLDIENIIRFVEQTLKTQKRPV